MSLVKGLSVDSDIYLDTYRKRDFILSGDYIRRIEMNKDVSMRASSLKADQLARVLTEISEEGAVFTAETLEIYDAAQDWFCSAMNKILPLTRGLGVRPTRMDRKVSLYMQDSSLVTLRGRDAIWFPVYAQYLRNERVYLFRVMPEPWLQQYNLIDAGNSGVIGYTAELLKVVSPELWSYVERLEDKASRDPDVERAFQRLASYIRPEATRAETIAKQQETYGASFGGWA